MSEEILVTLGEWQIRREGALVYGCHHKCEEDIDMSWFLDDKNPECYTCTAPVPDEIQALMLLNSQLI